MNEEKIYCSVCGKEISREEYESYDGLCWECCARAMKNYLKMRAPNFTLNFNALSSFC